MGMHGSCHAPGDQKLAFVFNELGAEYEVVHHASWQRHAQKIGTTANP
jgi:hypothetical protein